MTFSREFDPPQTTEFETTPVCVDIPSFIPAGRAGILVLNFYAECPFASEGAIVPRETFRLVVEIKEPI